MSKAELYELAESYRSEFPIFQTTVYLNSCSLGALSSRGRAALKEFADLWSSQGAAAWYEHWLAAADDVRSAFADLIGAEPAEVLIDVGAYVRRCEFSVKLDAAVLFFLQSLVDECSGVSGQIHVQVFFATTGHEAAHNNPNRHAAAKGARCDTLN